METENLPPEPISIDSETDNLDRSNPFEERQLIYGAETEDMELLPKVEGLSISGEAKPGHTLAAAGFSINGTWLRLNDTGGRVYIPGEKQAEHLVTADDVDSYLAVEVIPIGKEGQMEYNEDRQNVKLEFMEDRFIIKDVTSRHIVQMNSLPDMTIAIPTKSPTGFEIQSMEPFQSLKLEASSIEARDLIVLTMRSFLLRATQI